MSGNSPSDRKERAERMRKQRERAERRRRNLITGGIVVVVVVLIAVAGFAIISATDDGGSSGAPSNVTADGGIVYDREAATGKQSSEDAVEVVVYEDFQCPICAQFEQLNGDYLDQQVESGAVTVEYRPVAFLDDMSADEYSTRSLNAAACVVDEAGAKGFHEFKNLLFANQPAEGGPGLTAEQLTGYAEQAGAQDAGSCIDDMTYEGWVDDVTQAAVDADVKGTPKVLVEGKTVQNWSPQGLKAAIEEAAKP